MRGPAVVIADNAGNVIGVVDISGTKYLQTEVKRLVDPLPAGTNAIGVVSLDGTQLSTLATEATLATLGTETTLASIAAVDFSTEATLELVRLLLVSIDSKDFATQTTVEAIRVLLVSLDGKDFATETTLATRATEATLLAADGRLTTIDAVLDSIKDVDGIKKITDELPAGTQQIGLVAQGTKGAGSNAWPTVLYDAAGNAVEVTNDAGIYRLNILGKVTVTGAAPPPATTPAVIFGDTPLTVGTQDNTYVIPNGQTYYLQEIVAGNEDPTKGAVIEVLYFNGTEHLIARIYIAGQTVTAGYPDRSTARDGTSMVGNGSTFTIICRRTKFSGSNIAIDAVVRGYVA